MPLSVAHRSRLARIAAVTAVVAFAPAVSAQSNAELVMGGAYARSHDYDLVHQRIELRDFDWDSTSFEGRVATTVIARRPDLDSLILDAGELLGIRSVTAQGGTALRTSRHGDTLVVHLPRPAAFGDTVSFSIDYHGRVRNGRGLTFIQPEGRTHRPQQIWSQGEATNNHLWFPTYDAPNDKASWEVLATVPADFTAVSNGSLVQDHDNGDGTHTVHWSEEKPSATYLASLVVAPLVKVHDEWKGRPIDYYVYREDEPRARRLFSVTPDMIQTYTDLTGVDYPWAKYAQTTVADFFGGMENVSATTLVDWLPDPAAYADRPWYQWILIPHELAHQWFGDFVTTEDWADIWLNEGFAEFMPGQYWRVRNGEMTAEDYYLDEYAQYVAADQRRRMPIAALGSNVIYPKGALVLEMLHDYLGDDAFWAGVHRYLVDHAFGTATTDDLRQAFLDATGQNLDWFFSEWLYGAGHPRFLVTTTYDPAAQRLTIVAEQTQKDSLEASAEGLRYTTAEVFRMPVTVRVATAAGDVRTRDWIDQRVDTITVDGVTSEPRFIVFDEGNHVLKEMTFRQPTSRLAAQLTGDPDLWDRDWVIDRLAERTDDDDARDALIQAATSADYFLTRAEAASALAGFGDGKTRAALARDVASDTSAQVRAAAIEALGRIGGHDAARAAGDAFRTDSSYQVRAAALIAIARSDSANAAADIRTALESSSYRNVVRDAALSAIALTRDVSFLDDLEGMMGEDLSVSLALGSLAHAGSTRALDVLLNALDDDRAYVRRWALTSIANRLSTAIAVARLKSVAADLKYEDTKRAVDAVVRQLQSRRIPPGGAG